MITISANMEDGEAAFRLYEYLKEKSVEGLGIVDGAKVVANINIKSATITASYFHDFLDNR